jgi:hypothetical protein
MTRNANLPWFRKGDVIYMLERSRPDKAIKIGFTEDMPRRYRQLYRREKQVLTFRAVFPGSFALEAAFHRVFAEWRIPGTEWFWNPADSNEWLRKFARAMHEEDEWREKVLQAVRESRPLPLLGS